MVGYAKLNRFDRGAGSITTTGKDRYLSHGKGNTAEGFESCLALRSWDVGEYPADCHMIFVWSAIKGYTSEYSAVCGRFPLSPGTA